VMMISDANVCLQRSKVRVPRYV